MNTTTSKITIPSDFLLNFYYYYSYFTLTATWLITPLLVYVILTQSKNLKTFKWLILNHSFWCLALETFYASVKPLIFTPAIAGFSLGLLKNTTVKTTMIATFVGVVLIATCISSLGATLFCRYIFVFPSKVTKHLSLKSFLWFSFTLTMLTWIIIGFGVIPNLSIDEAEMFQTANEYDQIFLKFEKESSFIFLSLDIVQTPCLVIVILFYLVFIVSFVLIIFFIYSVKSQTKNNALSSNITNLNRSLIISSIVQVVCTCVFLIFPPYVLATLIYFQIPNSAGIYCFFSNIIVSHAYIEFIVTLYFVSPYRKFIRKCFKNIFACKSVTSPSMSALFAKY